MKPKALYPGDLVALIAPSSPFDSDRFLQGTRFLEELGYRLLVGEHVHKRRGYLAGSESERAEDFVHAFSNPEVSAVVCVRGGYGSSRLLPWISFPALRNHGKIFLGFSDATFLHMAFQSRLEWVTFHGPNLMNFAEHPEFAADLQRSLSGDEPFAWELQEGQILRQGVGQGRLIGGNLTCMVHLLGTPYFPDLEGAILMIEDCSEALYRLDRLLHHLKLAGKIEGLSGLVLGQFKDCGSREQIWEMVLDCIKSSRFPVVADLPFGHGPQNRIIPLGVPFLLNTYERNFYAVENPFES